MAMYEEMGYCPNNEFGQMGGLSRTHAWERAAELLGDRTGFMVYNKDITKATLTCGETIKVDPNVVFTPNCGVVDAIKGATGTLGIEIATAMRLLLPVCKYAETNAIINCFDVSEKEFCKALMTEPGYPDEPLYDRNGKLINRNPSRCSILLQDERFAVLLESAPVPEGERQVVNIFIHKRIV